MGPCLGEQRVGLPLERVHGVGTGGEAGRRILERHERYERLRELGRVATFIPVAQGG